MTLTLLDRRSFDTAALMAAHPPKGLDPNKRAIFDIACPPGFACSGTIVYTRWDAAPLPERLRLDGWQERVRVHDGVYRYEPAADGCTDWHVNFANAHLFFSYAMESFTQDDYQLAEHPALASVREAIRATGIFPLTQEGHRATPILVAGVERRCCVDVSPNAEAGRPHGIYGTRFARTPQEMVRRATTRLDPPTISNIIAIAAPVDGWGEYSAEDIEHILVTAYTGFAAAVQESAGPVRIHTGFWGCGAFGGDRTLMTMLQVIAAQAAGVERVEFYAFDESGFDTAQWALALLAETLKPGEHEAAAVIRTLAGLGLEWGVKGLD